jgi:surface carbohydrate biosynthesis protein
MFKFLFAKPKPVQVVILYEDQSELLKKWVLYDFTIAVLSIGNWVCLNPWIIASTIGKLFSFDYKYIFGGNILKQFIKFLYQCHIEAYICSISPKVVITWVDDSGLFHRLSRRKMNVEFFALQNGYRATWAIKDMLPSHPHPGSKISFSNFICFGYRDEFIYKSYGHEVDKYYPIGSMLGGIYWSRIADNRKIIFDICYISQWEKYLSDPGLIEDKNKSIIAIKLRIAVVNGLKILEDMLAELVLKKGLSFTIATRSNDLEEEKYFRSKFGESVNIMKSNRTEFSTYQAINNSHLTINLLSTCAFEAIGVGRKVLFCNPLCDDMLMVDSPEICTLLGNNQETFNNRVVQLINMSDLEYLESINGFDKYLMNYDLTNPPHCQIRSILENTILYKEKNKIV